MGRCSAPNSPQSVHNTVLYRTVQRTKLTTVSTQYRTVQRTKLTTVSTQHRPIQDGEAHQTHHSQYTTPSYTGRRSAPNSPQSVHNTVLYRTVQRTKLTTVSTQHRPIQDGAAHHTHHSQYTTPSYTGRCSAPNSPQSVHNTVLYRTVQRTKLTTVSTQHRPIEDALSSIWYLLSNPKGGARWRSGYKLAGRGFES